jgi:transcription elongation factor GreA
MKHTYLTAQGMQELKDKLQMLKTVRRREIAEAIHTAKEQGDLSENAEYTQAKEEQTRIEQEIAEIEATLKNAELITETNSEDVSIGNTVTVKCDGQNKTYQIVGSKEADPLKGKISNESPIGRALLGAKKGDAVRIPTPTGEKHCQVIKIA